MPSVLERVVVLEWRGLTSLGREGYVLHSVRSIKIRTARQRRKIHGASASVLCGREQDEKSEIIKEPLGSEKGLWHYPPLLRVDIGNFATVASTAPISVLCQAP